MGNPQQAASFSLLGAFYDSVASGRQKWIQKNRFYHEQMLRFYRFLVQENSRVLVLGCGTGELPGGLRAAYAVGVDISPRMIEIAKEKCPQIQFVCQDIEEFSTEETFDYIVIPGTLNSVKDIQQLLQKIAAFSTPDTRIILNCYNQLWNPLIKLAQKSRFKMPELIFNWLSVDDLENFLHISGYQVVKKDFLLLCPKYFPLVTAFLNKFLGILPLFRRFSLQQFLVARLNVPPANADQLKASVVLTCRDEEGNIEGLVKRIPEMGAHTEIIFVEGHSKDNTVEKIKEMIRKYPDKEIKLLKQKGIGQGDAFRMGFDEAKGDFVFWLEADLTTPPEEIKYFWDAYVAGRGEYVNGSRFIYKMEKKAMPFFNFLGNRFFGWLFTIFLGQRFTDTLCGFKAISKKNYMKIRREINYFGDFDPFGDFELIFGVIKNNLKVIEIPVHYQPRNYGEPKAYGKTLFSLVKHALLLFRMSWKAFRVFKLKSI